MYLAVTLYIPTVVRTYEPGWGSLEVPRSFDLDTNSRSNSMSALRADQIGKWRSSGMLLIGCDEIVKTRRSRLELLWVDLRLISKQATAGLDFSFPVRGACFRSIDVLVAAE